MTNSKIAQITILLLLIAGRAFSQKTELFVIEPFPLEITYNKTVNLIFPYPVKSVDKGSRDVLAQKAKGVDNILQTKAAKKDFEQTNLTVITSDGQLYSFIVNYSDQLSQLNIELVKDRPTSMASGARLTGHPNEELLKNMSAQAIQQTARIHRIRDASSKANLSLTGLYINRDVMYYLLKLENRSNIGYDIESLRFFIGDKKQVKRTAAQQTEIIPLYVHQDTSSVLAQQSHEFVYALPKFTTSPASQLSIQLTEKNGGRHLGLTLRNKHIIKAKPVR